MPALIFGVMVLILLLWAANVFAKADAHKLVKVMRPVGGAGALALWVSVTLSLGGFGGRSLLLAR